jgi:hypothetical protein
LGVLTVFTDGFRRVGPVSRGGGLPSQWSLSL